MRDAGAFLGGIGPGMRVFPALPAMFVAFGLGCESVPPPVTTSTSTASLPPAAASSPVATAPAAAATEASIRASRDAGVRWLIATQSPDGSFGQFHSARPYEIYLDNLSSHRAFQVATSALCTWALVEPARSDPDAAAALERALDWILKEPVAARASGGTFYDVWAHTYLLDLAAAVLEDDRLVDRHEDFRTLAMREVLISRERQTATGGWGYYDFGENFLHPTGHLSTSFNTGAMILALRAVQRNGVEVPQAMIQDALVCLRRMQLPNGSFAYGIYVQYSPQAGFNQVRGASGRLQVCNLALYDEGDGVDAAQLASGLAKLRDHHHYIAMARGRPRPHEAYYSNSGYYYYFGHFYAALVATRLAPGPQRDELARWLAGVFIADQHTDGSWFDYPLYGYGHAYATGYAVLSASALIPLLADGSGAAVHP